jgi:hypothetical protein
VGRTSWLRQKIALLFLIALVVLPGMARGQSGTTGAITGEARDATGAVLPGVTVEAASPALIEKMRTAVTDDRGRYFIGELRPGVYTVTFTLPGFSSVRREGLELSTGFTAPVDAELRVGGVEETITVSGSSPVVDITNVRSQNVLTREVLDTLPTSRSVQALSSLTLGAVTTGQSLGGGDAGGSKGDTVFGFAQIHGSPQGIRTIDGMKMSSAYRVGASTRLQMNQMMVEEIVLDTSAASADTESGGLNVNLVPKDGGNNFRGSFLAEYTNDSLQGSNLTDALRDRGLLSANEVQKIYDVGVGFGGPLRQDRLWFFTALRAWGSLENLAGVYFNANQEALSPSTISAVNPPIFVPDLSRPAYYDRNTKDGGIRLTWQATSKQKVSFTGNVQDYCWCYSYSINNAEAAWHFQVYPNNNWMATWSYPMTSRLLLQAGGSLRQDRQFNGTPEEAGDALPMLDLATGVAYGSRFITTTFIADTEWGDMGNQYAYQTRASLSYVTGTHAFKFGMQTMTGRNEIRDVSPPYSVQFQLRNGVPASLKQGAFPHSQLSRLKLMMGLYGQDQWTLGKLTLNLGVRYDGLNAYNPPQTRPGGEFVPETSFPGVYDQPNWKDINPRLGVAYDVFGNGKTAIKGSFNRYVNYDTTGLTQLTNPAGALVVATTRSWTDSNGDFKPDCDLKLPGQNGECGPMANQQFGTTVVNTRYAEDVTKGWHVRPYNNQVSAVLQQELRPGFGVTIGYFRTWYGNKTVNDNVRVTPADFTPFCVTAPVDSRLPDGGGYQICNVTAVSADKFGQTDNLVVRDDGRYNLTEVFNGIDIAMNWRFGGGLLNGGVSFGRTQYNNCGSPDPPDQTPTFAVAAGGYCEYELPWAAQTQIKLQAAYPLPAGVRVAATYQDLPGIAQAATRSYTNAEIAPSLGRPLAGSATQQVIRIVEPNVMLEDRQRQIDLRFTRAFRLQRMTISPKFDIYNLTNSPAVMGSIAGYGTTWLRPTDILTARIAKFGVQVDW